MAKSTLPYSGATSGDAARGEISRILRHFGCESIGFMDMVKDHSVLLQFEHGGRTVKLQASAKGWAAMWLKENPYTSRRRCSPDEWRQRALEQGIIAINSILRDWVKGQVTAIQCGIMSFNEVFMPHMLSNDGRRLVEVFEQYLALPAPSAAP